MPLDFAGSHIPLARLVPPWKPQITLTEAAHVLGIEPIPLADLETHKRAEAARHPGSVLVKHAKLMQDMIAFVFLASFMTGFISALWCLMSVGLRLSWWVPLACLAVAFCGMVGSLLATSVTLKMPARWIEDYSPITTVPKPIADLAWEVHHLVPTAHFVVGKLVQNSINLDPYLVMEYDPGRGLPERIALGIWDHTGVIRVADRH